MEKRRTERDGRRAREFEAFVAGAGGRLLHAAALLTGEPPQRCPAAEDLLIHALARTYAAWDTLRGEDPYDRARQELAARFACTAWRYRTAPWRTPPPAGTTTGDRGGGTDGGRDGGADGGRDGGADRAGRGSGTDGSRKADGGAGTAGAVRDWFRRIRFRRNRPGTGRGGWSGGGLLDRLTPQERLVLVLRIREGVAEEQAAAVLGLPPDRVRALCNRAVFRLADATRPPGPRGGSGTRTGRAPDGRPAGAAPERGGAQDGPGDGARDGLRGGGPGRPVSGPAGPVATAPVPSAPKVPGAAP